jgi:hypothetical protein
MAARLPALALASSTWIMKYPMTVRKNSAVPTRNRNETLAD